MGRRRGVVGFVGLLVGSAACSDKLSPSSDRAEQVAAARVAQAPATAGTAAGTAQGAAAATYWATQKLIRTADLRVQVKDVPAAVSRADSLARPLGALVADSRQSQHANGAREARLVLRVPSDRFAPILAALRTLGDVKGESMTTQDVTKEYADLETRLAVKEQTVARLRSLFDSRAAKLSDVLEVEQELSRAVTELEQLKGERRYYDQQIAMSTIGLTLFEVESAAGPQIFLPVTSALRTSLDVFARSLGGLIYAISFVLPWALLAAVIWWLLKRFSTRRRKHDSSVYPQSGPP
jgi:hypothetical protein